MRFQSIRVPALAISLTALGACSAVQDTAGALGSLAGAAAGGLSAAASFSAGTAQAAVSGVASAASGTQAAISGTQKLAALAGSSGGTATGTSAGVGAPPQLAGNNAQLASQTVNASEAVPVEPHPADGDPYLTEYRAYQQSYHATY